MRVIVCCILYLGLMLAQDKRDSLNNTSTTNGYPPIESILVEDNVIVVPKTIEFIERLGAELEEKTGFFLKVVIIEDAKKALMKIMADKDISLESLDSKAAIALHTKKLQDSMPQPQYTIIVFYVNDQKIDFVVGDRDVFNKKLEDRVYFEYMVPLLPKHNETLTKERISAIILNGYAEAADLIAIHYGKTLELNIPRDESGGKEFVKISMYVLLALLFGVLGFVYITSKFFKK